MEKNNQDELWESFFYPGTTILKNKKDIRNQEKLDEVEKTITALRLLELAENPINLDFKREHLRRIHEYVFQDIYDFAGKFRNVNMQKKRGSYLYIKDENDIVQQLDEVLMEGEEKLQRCTSKYQFAEVLAFLYTNILHCHPFREGNTRSTREFIREYALLKSKKIGLPQMEFDWRNINQAELDEYLEINYMVLGPTAMLFYNCLTETEKKIQRN